MTKRSSILTAVAMASTCLTGAALAQQYANSPFYEHTVALSQAYGIEAIGLRLDLAEAFSAPYDDELAETIEGVTGTDFQRFAGTLGANSPQLAEALTAALGEVAEAVETGTDVTEAVIEARALLAEAYAAVIPPEMRDQPAFKGGVIINLLLAEGGVAEGYEEAVENSEPWEYPNGWAALQRVNALWEEVKGSASAERLADGQEMLDLLDTLYPEAQPPASVAGLNPEEAESPSQRLGGIVEEVTDADLYPGRDLPRLMGHLAELTTAACAVYPQNDAVASETVYAVHDLFATHLEDVSGMFAPELQEHASELFGALIAAEDDDDDAGEAAAGDEGEDDDLLSTTDACAELATAFAELRTVLGG